MLAVGRPGRSDSAPAPAEWFDGMNRQGAAHGSPRGIPSGFSAPATLPQATGEGGGLPAAPRRPAPPVPRLALSPDECALALGVSRDFFDEHVLPELRIVRRGRRRLVPVRELERWVEREAALAVGEERRR